MKKCREPNHDRLGIHFGRLQDAAVQAECGGEKIDAFRELHAGEHPVTDTLTWKGAVYHARIQCGNVEVFSFPWGVASALRAAHAIPTES